MTLRPSYPCVVIKSKKSYDGYGRPEYKTQRVKTRCDVIHLREGAERTTVREDSSASRGRAEEYVNDARLMFGPREDIRLGDLVELTSYGEAGDNVTIEVKRVQRRLDVSSRIHHIEIDGDRHDTGDM